MKQELIDYIKRAKEKGVKEDYLIQHLIKYGYSKEAAENAILEYKRLYPEKKKKNVSILIFILLILIALILISVIFFTLKPKSFSTGLFNSCPDVLIDLMKKENEPLICIAPGVKTLFIIENKGGKVNGFEINLIGTKGSQFFFINESLDKTETMPLHLDYDISKNGNLTQLKIIPIKENKCKEIIFEVKKFGIC